MAAVELAERHVIAQPVQARNDHPAALIDGQDLVGRPVRERKNALARARAWGSRIRASTRRREETDRRWRSPGRVAHDAPSENPPIAIRRASTETLAKTRSSARFRKTMSSPKLPRIASQVTPRDSGASRDDASLFGRRADAAHHARGVLGCAMQKYQKGHRALRVRQVI